MNRIIITLMLCCVPWFVLAKEPPMQVLGPANVTIRDFCTSPHGTLVFAAIENRVDFYEVRTGKLAGTLRGDDPSEILALDLSEDSTWLVTGTSAGNLHIRNLVTGTSKLVSCSETGILSVDVHGPSGLIAAGTYAGEVILADLQGNIAQKLETHNDLVTKVSISHDGRMLAVSGMDGQVILIRLSGEKESIILADKSSPCRDVAFNHETTYLSAAYDNGRVLRWRIDNNESFHVVPNARVPGWVTGVSWHHDNMTWTACTSTGNIRIFTRIGGVYKTKLKGIIRKIMFVDPNAADLYVILSLSGKGLRIVHASDMKVGNPSSFNTSDFWYQNN